METEQNSHSISLTDRRLLTMTGVSRVVRFEDSVVVAETGLGTLMIQGKGLKLQKLAPEGGNVAVEGTISALVYEEPRTGYFRRLFG